MRFLRAVWAAFAAFFLPKQFDGDGRWIDD